MLEIALLHRYYGPSPSFRVGIYLAQCMRLVALECGWDLDDVYFRVCDA